MGTLMETPRLLLREQTLDDVDALLAVLGDPITMRFYPRAFNRDEVRQWIERSMFDYEHRDYGLYALVLKETGEFIGQCGLRPQVIDKRDEVECGWHVHRLHQSRGYATEAARAVQDFAFSELGFDRLISLIRPVNVPSKRVAEKLGMTPEKEVIHGTVRWRHIVFVQTRDEGLAPHAT